LDSGVIAGDESNIYILFPFGVLKEEGCGLQPPLKELGWFFCSPGQFSDNYFV